MQSRKKTAAIINKLNAACHPKKITSTKSIQTNIKIHTVQTVYEFINAKSISLNFRGKKIIYKARTSACK